MIRVLDMSAMSQHRVKGRRGEGDNGTHNDDDVKGTCYWSKSEPCPLLRKNRSKYRNMNDDRSKNKNKCKSRNKNENRTSNERSGIS